MKISKNYEQAIYVLLILSTQYDNTPIKSSTLSDLLEVSDSSLKKILRKLVVKGLISSNASKDGGFAMKKSVNKITLLDVMMCIESDQTIRYSMTHLAREIFPNKDHTIESENLVIETLKKAEKAFNKELNNVYIGDLLELDLTNDKTIDWNMSLNK